MTPSGVLNNWYGWVPAAPWQSDAAETCKYANMIVLSDDIMTMDEGRIKDIVSDRRVVAGKVVHGGDKHGLSDPINLGSRSKPGVA